MSEVGIYNIYTNIDLLNQSEKKKHKNIRKRRLKEF